MFGSTNPFGGQQQQPPAFGFGSGSKPFGSPSMSPFGSPAFGGSSTGVFGQPSAPAFGQATASPFGSASSAPAFGAQSAAPAFGGGGGFGASSGGFGGSSTFGQKPAFGGFGSTASQGSAFGSTFGASSQPAFGNSLFGSTTPFGAPSQPAFGAASTPAFGATSTPAFGAASTPAFGTTSTPAFGATSTPTFGSSTTPAFGSTATPAFGSTPTPLFGSTGAGFGVSSAPPFGSSVTPGFGAQSTSMFGSSSTTAFGAPSTPSFGVSSTPATPSFGFGTTPAFGQSSSTPFGTTSFGSQSSPFGAQTTTPNFGSPGFGQSAFGGQAAGTRVAPFTPTPEAETGTASQPAGKLESISAMPIYKDKSHEELRWEDYQRGDKGGPNPSGQPASGITFPAASQAPNPFGSTPTFGQPPANPFSSTSSNLFAPKTPTTSSTGFGSTSSIFTSAFNSTSPFGQPTTTPAFGAPSTSAFGSSTSSSIFGQPTSTPSNSPFGQSPNFGNTQSSGLFQTSPSLGQTQSIFGQSSTGFQQPSTGFQPTSTGFQPTTPGLNTNIFSTPSTGFGGNMFSTQTPSLQPSNPIGFGQTTPSFAPTFQATPQTSSSFTFNNNFGQTQQATSAGFGSTLNIGMPGQSATPLPNMVAQPTVITNPFGSLPPVPQMTIGRARSTPSVQYGISSMPVAEEPMPVRISSLAAPRHLSQRRIRLPARKYHPKPDGQRVPFFVDEEVAPTTPKADALFFPRENPRTLIVRPIEQWPSRTTGVKPSVVGEARPANGNDEGLREPSAPVVGEGFVEDHDSGSPDENGHNWENNNAPPSPTEPSQKPNGAHAEHAQKGTDSPSITISGHRAGEAAIAYEHGADIEALMPKLRHSDYYTVPRIQELAAKERAKPGFCRHVKDFVVGRHGYGSILFYGETDVRRLDLESIVQFNNREVIVYVEESKKPPVGQGLNKPAEVTLLNIKCMNKKTGQQVTEGPRVEKYREMLMKKTEEQGAEFVSYNPDSGEWKFKVKHFSKYGFGGECLEFSEVDYQLDGGDTAPHYKHGDGDLDAFRS